MKCPQCQAEMNDHGLIAIDHGRGNAEMERYDCPNDKCDTTVLIGYTSQMGDEKK